MDTLDRGTINNNVLTMHLQRDAWQEVSKMLEANGGLPDSYWWEFMRDTYATTQAVAVRRQADTHRDAASLGTLIEEIRDDASRIKREFWIYRHLLPGGEDVAANLLDTLLRSHGVR